MWHDGARDATTLWVRPLYRLKTASQRSGEVLTALAQGLDVCAAVHLFGHRHATITTWLMRAREHRATLHDRTFQGLDLAHVQFDELRTRLRSRAHTLWLWLAVEKLSKIIPVLHHPEGTRGAHPASRARRGPHLAPAAGSRLPPSVE
jgi:hypothetical protein